MERVAVRRGSGNGKLLLFGEHAAVYGHPALGLTLPESTSVTALLEGSGVRAPGLYEADRELFARLIEHLSERIPELRRTDGEFHVETTIPRASGFGSSAALCAALARALLPSDTPVRELWSVANFGERFFHGTPSGIDTGLALLGGLLAFAPAPPDLPRARALGGFPLALVVGALPRGGSTASLVGALRERVTAREPIALGAIAELGSIAAQAEASVAGAAEQWLNATRAGSPEAAERIARGGAERLGALARSAHAVLATLGLSTAALDALLEEGVRLGALGGKLSGAGGGGAFYLLYPTPQAAHDAAERLAATAAARSIHLAAPIRSLSWRPPPA